MGEVQMSGRLVQQQDPRFLGQRPRDQDELSLAPRKVENRSVRELFDAHPCHHIPRQRDVRAGLETEHTQVRRAAHQDHFDHPERKRNRRVLGNHRELFREISA